MLDIGDVMGVPQKRVAACGVETVSVRKTGTGISIMADIILIIVNALFLLMLLSLLYYCCCSFH